MANETKISSLIDPQVISDYFDLKLTDALKFTNIADVDTTLVGRAGDTLSLPVYAYIGDATDVEELGAIPVAELTSSMQDVKVKKVGRGVKLSDEAILSAHGDPVGEATKQLLHSVASKLDNDVMAVLNNATKISPCVSVTPNAVNEALVLFGEDLEGTKYLYVSPASLPAIRKATDWIPASQLAAEVVVKGVVGYAYGCLIVPTNKITSTDTAYIIKPGAVKLILKRDTVVEPIRDGEHRATEITVDKHYVAYLYDQSKVIKMGTATLGELTVTQTTGISSSKAKVAVTNYPTNLSYGWKAYYKTNMNAAETVAVGDDYATTWASTFATEYEGEVEYAATNAKVFQVIYVDADGKVRASGYCTLATSIS